GDTVTISGSGFSNKPGQNVVTFAGVSNTSIRATILNVSSTSLQVKVPVGAISGPVIVRIANRSSRGFPVTVVAVNPPPGTIVVLPSTVVPGSPSVDVQVSGTNFISTSQVYYDGKVKPSLYKDKNLLIVTLSTTDLNPAIHHMDVVNPLPGGGASN